MFGLARSIDESLHMNVNTVRPSCRAWLTCVIRVSDFPDPGSPDRMVMLMPEFYPNPDSATASRVLCIVGTRPEAIKMAPVILALRQSKSWDVKVVATAQHRELLDQVLGVFGIAADKDLDAMRPNQDLAALTARLITGLDACLEEYRPALVLAQGDTTTVLASALACFYRKVPFGHVEAGLRTRDFDYPWPEEMNRVLAGRLAAVHFAPTETARVNLLQEGIPADRVHVTGNTVIDALFWVAERDFPVDVELPRDRRLVLVTAHRRENFGAPMVSICEAIADLARRYDDLHFLFPVHPNPNVRQVVEETLGGMREVTLCAPLQYGAFVAAMKRSWLVLSDSGGVQEEAPALGKPVLVLRDETERPEAVAEGVVELVGTAREAIVRKVAALYDDPSKYCKMAKGASPYGDGQAAARIVQHIGRLPGVGGSPPRQPAATVMPASDQGLGATPTEAVDSF